MKKILIPGIITALFICAFTACREKDGLSAEYDSWNKAMKEGCTVKAGTYYSQDNDSNASIIITDDETIQLCNMDFEALCDVYEKTLGESLPDNAVEIIQSPMQFTTVYTGENWSLSFCIFSGSEMGIGGSADYYEDTDTLVFRSKEYKLNE